MPFKKGEAKPENSGRKKGTQNKNSALLQFAILLAAEQLGEGKPRISKRRYHSGEDDGLTEVEHAITNQFDWDGEDGLVGYLRYLGKWYPKTMAVLLGRVLPLQVRVQRMKAEPIETFEDLQEVIRERGLDKVLRLPRPRNLIEHRPNEYIPGYKKPSKETIRDDDDLDSSTHIRTKTSRR